MLRDTSPGARPSGVPVSGSASRQPASLLRRVSWVGALLLACGPLAAQTVSPNASTPSLAQPCSSAKAVHDMRCPNYTGFKTRLGGRAPAVDPLGRAASDESLSLEGSGLGLKPGREQRGIASWYGPGFHGRRTASGERYDMHELTAAHKSLPFGTRVLVHNPRNGRQVVVRINDRGPYAHGRVIDLSKAAAQAVGMHGTDAVVLRTLGPGDAEHVQTAAPGTNAPPAGRGELTADSGT